MMLPREILPLLTVPGTDGAVRLAVEAYAGEEPFSGWLLDRHRNVVARLLNFRFRFQGFDREEETAAAFHCHIPARLPAEPAPVALALEDPRLVRHGPWRETPDGLLAQPPPAHNLLLRSAAPRVTLRFLSAPDGGIVRVRRNAEVLGTLDLRDPVQGLPCEFVVDNPDAVMGSIFMVPQPRHGRPEGRVLLAGIEEHTGPEALPAPRRLPANAEPNPGYLPQFRKHLSEMPAEAWALNIGAGPGRPAHPRLINLDWLAFDGPDLLADPLALPFPSNSLDLVQANGVINRLADPAGLAREIYRVLKPGGRAVIGAIPSQWQRYGGPQLLHLTPAALGAGFADFSQLHFDHGGGLAERVMDELHQAGLDAAGHATELAELRGLLERLAAALPAAGRAALPFWTVLDARK